ncbi:MAG TPA: hypothetical protein VGP55_04435, partial [Chitinophagaceae bacterium]|nr:hypothetical protein [Chitinophagaceae bacterium]
MKIKIIFLFLLFAGAKQSNAQYYFYDGRYYESDFVYEIGGSIGAMNAFTDLGGRKGIGKKFVKDFNFKNTQLSGGFYMGVVYKNQIAVRLEATFGEIHAYDSILKKVAATTNERYERN